MKVAVDSNCKLSSYTIMANPFTLDRVVRLVITLALIACGVWLTGLLTNVLLPFCLACLLAYILDPLVEYNQKLFRLGKRRVIAVFLTIIDVTLVLALLVYLFLPTVIDEINQMMTLIKESADNPAKVSFLPANLTEIIQKKLNFDQIVIEIEKSRASVLLDKGESLVENVVEILLHSLEWLLTFIYVIFILIDYDQFSSGAKMLIPPKYRSAVGRIGNDVKESMNKYFRSQLLIALCAAVLYCIGFYIAGLPMAIVMGVLVGILYMIPYFQYITLIPVIFICFVYSLDGTVVFWHLLGKCLLVYVVSQCICDYVLTPKIMGKSLGLNPAVILLSLSIWGTLLGIIGMIIALPATTLLLAYYKKIIIDHQPVSSPTFPD